MNERVWERLGAGSGLASAVLLVAALLVSPPMPAIRAPADVIATHFAESGLRVRLAALLLTLSAVVFLWFVGHLRHVLQRAERGAEAFSPVVLASGVSLAVVTAFVGIPTVAIVSLAQRPATIGTAEALRALYDVHLLSMGPSGLLVALFAGTAGAAMVRREMTGPWLGWLGLALALIGVVAGVATFFATATPLFMVVMLYLTAAAFALWVATTSVIMLYRPEVERTIAARATFAH